MNFYFHSDTVKKTKLNDIVSEFKFIKLYELIIYNMDDLSNLSHDNQSDLTVERSKHHI